jgi:hypothetical protein
MDPGAVQSACCRDASNSDANDFDRGRGGRVVQLINSSDVLCKREPQ